jgi:hypothetical protein
MSSEIRIAVVVRLPEEPTGTALPAKTVLVAWEAFTTAIKGTEVVSNDFYMGPQKQRRRRKPKPKLVAETAA